MRKTRIAILASLLMLGVAAGAASAREKILFQNDHIRLVEVTNAPGANRLPAVPYPSVVFSDTALPKSVATGPTSDWVLPRDNRPYPFCFTEGPQPAKTFTVEGSSPQHYYRIDYKRVDGAAYAANWSKWYADVFGPPRKVVADPDRSLVGGKPYSKEWPYDIRYSATTSAPANHTVRYQDAHIEMVEVAIRQGETEHMHGHPYPSVYADDGGFLPQGAVYKNGTLGPDTGPPFGKMSADIKHGVYPNCFSAVPEAPHQVSVIKGPPQHFYRVHFKRIDGKVSG